MKSRKENHRQDALDVALTSLYSGKPPQGFEASLRAAISREEKDSMQKPTKERRSPQRVWRVALPLAAALVLVIGAGWVGQNQAMLEQGILIVETEDGHQVTALGRKSSDSEYISMDEAEAPMTEAAMDMGNYGMASVGGGAAAPMNEGEAEAGKKLVRTASLTLATTRFEEADGAIKALVAAQEGYVEDMYQYTDGSSQQLRRVSYSLRVPTGQLDAFLEGAAGVGRVTARNESTTDKSIQYADTALRLQTQKDKMTRLQELLQRAENVSDLLEIETEIANTQYEIDSYETSLRTIDRDVDSSMVSITLLEESAGDAAAQEDVSLGQRIVSGLSASLKGLGQFFQNMLVFVVMALPVLAPLAVIVAIVVLARRRRRQSRESQDAQALPQQPAPEDDAPQSPAQPQDKTKEE